MDTITVLLTAGFGASAVIQTLSASYFEVGYALTNKMFPSGTLSVGSIDIPNHRVVTFFYPKWLYRGGHASKWLQYLLAIPVVGYFGWIPAAIYLAIVMGSKLLMALVSTSKPAQYVSLAIMRGHLERKIRLKQFRWDKGTNDEGEKLFEALYRGALALIEALPERA